MDPAAYLPMFLAECREHLQELDVAIVTLERNPRDPEGVDRIFRVVHSVKGMAGTMGFAGMAQLSHEMEEVFEVMRQRTGSVDREVIDVVLQCLDALAAAVDAIERDGEEQIDPAPLIPRLRRLTRSAGAPDRPTPGPAPLATVPGALTARIEFEAGAPMPSVLASLLLSTLRERGVVLASSPTEQDLDAWDGGTLEIAFDADYEQSEIEAVAGASEGIAALSFARAHTPDEEAAAKSQSTSATPRIQPSHAGAAKAAPASHRTVRVDADRLDQLMHHMGELVVQRTRLAALVDQAEVPGIAQAMQDLERITQTLRAMVMAVRMIEVEAVFARLPRLVRDLASKLGKDVELELHGADTELDRTVVDALGDPLVHLVRNAIDHGLESRTERVAAGKPPIGRLSVSARQVGGGVVITVSDDGRGVDTAAVAARARERGILEPGVELSEEQAAELLFVPGFSTARRQTDVSGRGVGMDAARDAVRALGGDVTIASARDAGTLVEIRLPLTLAITAALVVEVARLPFAIPLDRIERTLALEDHTVRTVAGHDLLILPDAVVPLIDAAEVLTGVRAGEVEHAVIVRAGTLALALGVGELIGQRELVTRPLPPELETSRPISAGAVLAEGEIALIVDCEALIDAIPRELSEDDLAA